MDVLFVVAVALLALVFVGRAVLRSGDEVREKELDATEEHVAPLPASYNAVTPRDIQRAGAPAYEDDDVVAEEIIRVDVYDSPGSS